MTRSKKLKKRKLTKGDAYVIPLDASIKSNIVYVDDSGNIKMLSEVSPDAIFSSITDITGKLTANISKDKTLSAEQAVKISNSLSELGKRTVAVNILRDALYRLEEFQMNGIDLGNTNSGQYKLYVRIIEAAETISKAELEEAEAANSIAKANLEQIRESKLDKAISFENDAFSRLIEQDFKGAYYSFSTIENFYPSFRSAFEIKNLLKKNLTELEAKSPSVIKKVFKEIHDNYQVPSEFKDKVKELSND